MESEIKEILARLDRLERQNKRLKGVAVVFILMTACALLMAAQTRQPAKVIEAQAFVVKNERGKALAHFGLNDKGGVGMTIEKSGEGVLVSLGAGGLFFSHIYNQEWQQSLLTETGLEIKHTYLRSNLDTNRIGLRASGINSSIELEDAAKYKTVIGTAELVNKRTGNETTTSSASIRMFDSKGDVLWAAP